MGKEGNSSLKIDEYTGKDIHNHDTMKTVERRVFMNKEKMNLIFIGNLLEILFVCFASSSIEYMSLFFGFSKKVLFGNMLGIIFIGIIIYLVYILKNY